MEKPEKQIYEEKVLKCVNGYVALAIEFLLIAGSVLMIVLGHIAENAPVFTIGYVLIPVNIFFLFGFITVSPNEAAVLVLFGKYKGTIKQEGFYWRNPFCAKYNPAGAASGAKMNFISLKSMTLNNEKQKVNDAEGNPIEIGVVVIWRIKDTARAVFNVDNYVNFISIQSDAAIRNIARQYPYDVSEDGDEKSLRGSAQEIAEVLCDDLQKRVAIAGLEVVEARIAHLAYAQEIAAAMLQRQQAKAVVDARTTIVEGAVGMVELALDRLSGAGMVELDDERKAQMVTNLMVVLCANKDVQPVVNTGTLY